MKAIFVRYRYRLSDRAPQRLSGRSFTAVPAGRLSLNRMLS